MEKELKFNQCQDCGCPGAKLVIEDWGSRCLIVKCPYCGRKGVPFPKPSRGDGKTITRIILMIASWNAYNRENKEVLA